MKKSLAFIVCVLFLACALISVVHAEEDSIADQFLGSPLLALAVIIIIVVIAFLYRKIRR